MAIRTMVACTVTLALACAACKRSRQLHDPALAAIQESRPQVPLPSPANNRVEAPPTFEDRSLDSPAAGAVQLADSAESGSPPEPPPSPIEGPHPVEDYIQLALIQNPRIHAARKRLEAAVYEVQVANSLQDPTVAMTAFPEQIQTAAGQQEFTFSTNQRLPWLEKLKRRTERAQARVEIARAEVMAAELATVESVKQAYYELYYIQKAIEITEVEQQLLREIRGVAQTRYRTNQTTQQDVLRADLEILTVQQSLIRLRQQLDSGQARLARILYVAPQSELKATSTLSAEQAPPDLGRLHRQALSARPELHAQLAAVRRDRRSAELARLEYLPDVTLGMTWIDVAEAGISPVANGRDAFLVNLSLNLPLYRNRLSATVSAADAQTLATARTYEALHAKTVENVTHLFTVAHSQHDLLQLFQEDILPTARQTFNVSRQAYTVGEVDFLQLLDNWRQLLRYETTYHRLEASLRQTLAELETVVGGIASPPFALPEPNDALIPAARP